MKSNFRKSVDLALAHEGGYVDHPRDPGGATNLGVTIHTARRLGIDIDGDGDTDKVDIKLLKKADARKVYKSEYWDKVAGDALPSGLDHAVFDFAVNSGPRRAAAGLQRVLGIADDGVIGPITLAAIKHRNVPELIRELCRHRLDFMKRLSTWGTFGRGWQKRVDRVQEEALGMVGPAGLGGAAPPPPRSKPKEKTMNSSRVGLVILIIAVIAAGIYAKSQGWF